MPCSQHRHRTQVQFELAAVYVFTFGSLLAHNYRGTLMRPSLPLGDDNFESTRAKPRAPFASLAYRAIRVFVFIFGRERILRLLLDSAWLIRRLAYEQACQFCGNEFINRCYDFTPERLRKWIPPGSTVIDLGCGDGRVSQIAAQAGAKSVIGIDYSESRIEDAKRLQSGIANLSFFVGDLTKSLTKQFADHNADVALLIHVLEHIDDPVPFLVDIAGIAHRLIVEVPDLEGDHLNIARRALNTRLYSDDDHVREYTAKGLASELTAAGWNVLHIEQRRGTVVMAVAEWTQAKI